MANSAPPEFDASKSSAVVQAYLQALHADDLKALPQLVEDGKVNVDKYVIPQMMSIAPLIKNIDNQIKELTSLRAQWKEFFTHNFNQEFRKRRSETAKGVIKTHLKDNPRAEQKKFLKEKLLEKIDAELNRISDSSASSEALFDVAVG